MASFQDGAAAFDSGDYKAAMKIWLPLAQGGHVVAQRYIAMMYAKGRGIKQNDKEAANWYLEAAKGGNGQARMEIANYYMAGRGVKQDRVQAVFWARQAARVFPPGVLSDEALSFASQTEAMLSEEQAAELAKLMEGADGRVPTVAEKVARKLDPRKPDEFKSAVLDYHKRTKLKGDSMIAGNVQFVGLEKLRDRLGDEWPKTRDKVHEVVDAVIERHLSELDLFVRSNEMQYVVLFGGSLRKEAEETGQRIANDVQAALAQFLPGDIEITIRAVAVVLSGDAALGALGSIEALASSVDEAQSKAETTEREVVRDATAEMQIAYWPMLQTHKRLISVYAGELTSAGEKAAEVLAQSREGDGTGVLGCELDIFALSEASKALQASGKIRQKAAAIVAARFETVAIKTFRDRYLAECRKLPAVSSRRLVLLINNMPQAIPQARLHQVFNYLAPFFVGFACEVRPDYERLDALAFLKLRIISVDGTGWNKIDDATNAQLIDLSARARKLRMKVMARGLKTVELAQKAHKAGASYVNGPGVFPRVGQFGRVYYIP